MLIDALFVNVVFFKLVKDFEDVLDSTVIFNTVHVSQNFTFSFLFVSDSSQSHQAVKFRSLSNLLKQGEEFQFKPIFLYV